MADPSAVAIKGIGKERAKRLVEYREAVEIAGRNAFSSLNDLVEVGMTAKAIARLVSDNC